MSDADQERQTATVSKTPNTDAQERVLQRQTHLSGYVPVDFARRQEERIAVLERSLDVLVPSWRNWRDLAYEHSCLESQRKEINELKDKLARYEQNKTFGEAAHSSLQKAVDEASGD